MAMCPGLQALDNTPARGRRQRRGDRVNARLDDGPSRDERIRHVDEVRRAAGRRAPIAGLACAIGAMAGDSRRRVCIGPDPVHGQPGVPGHIPPRAAPVGVITTVDRDTDG